MNFRFVVSSIFAVMQAARLWANVGRYMIVDISEGPSARSYPVIYLDEVPSAGWTDVYKTDKIVLRRVEPCRFTMSDETEVSEWKTKYDEANEIVKARLLEYQCPVREISMTRPYYIGVFEVTQRQYELVTGTNPVSAVYSGPLRPVSVSWEDLRSISVPELTHPDYDWPNSDRVHPDSFFGILRRRTGLAGFDLPTEARWECACKAGRQEVFGKDGAGRELDMDRVGCYRGNCHDTVGVYTNGPKNVGSYMPNGWGIYDMHGNVAEWCLDWCAGYNLAYSDDPRGPEAPYRERRVIRGGGWWADAAMCRSSARDSSCPWRSGNGMIGFRVACGVDLIAK